MASMNILTADDISNQNSPESSAMSNLSVACDTHIALHYGCWARAPRCSENPLCLCFGLWLTRVFCTVTVQCCTGVRREMSSQSHHRPLEIHTYTPRLHSPLVNCQGCCTTSDIIPFFNNRQLFKYSLNRLCGHEQVCPSIFNSFTPVRRLMLFLSIHKSRDIHILT